MEEIVKEIDESYNQEILNIIRRSPITTDQLTLCFDRSPDFFALPKAGFDHSKYAGFIIDRKLKGFVGVSYYTAMVNDEAETIFYYTNLYVLPEARKRGFFFRSSEVLLKAPYNNARIGVSVVMKGNENANRLVGRRSEDYPFVFPTKICGSLSVKNIVITLKKREGSSYSIRKATQDDVEGIVFLLKQQYADRTFAPLVTKEEFLKNIERRPNFELNDYFVAVQNGSIVGVCGVLDTNNLKQTRVLEYKGKFKWIRMFYRLLTPLLGLPKLPEKGGAFKDITLIDHASSNNDPKIMEALITRIYNIHRQKNYNTIIFGSYSGDPILDAANNFYSTNVESNILLGCKSEKQLDSIEVNKPYINIAFL